MRIWSRSAAIFEDLFPLSLLEICFSKILSCAERAAFWVSMLWKKRTEFALLMIIWTTIDVSHDNASFATPKTVESSTIFCILLVAGISEQWSKGWKSQLLFVSLDDGGSFCVYCAGWRGWYWTPLQFERFIALRLGRAGSVRLKFSFDSSREVASWGDLLVNV